MLNIVHKYQYKSVKPCLIVAQITFQDIVSNAYSIYKSFLYVTT